MKTTPTKQSTKNATKYLIYAAFILLIVNFLLIFLPFIEIYQPSYKVTTLDVITYEDWYLDRAPLAHFITPIFCTGIPYLCAIIAFAVSSKKKKSASNFVKIKNNIFTKPIRFFWLKIASVINLITMVDVYVNALEQIISLREQGAYVKITLFGILNFLCTIALVAILFILSRKTKSMFEYIKLASAVSPDFQQMEATENAEIMKDKE